MKSWTNPRPHVLEGELIHLVDKKIPTLIPRIPHIPSIPTLISRIPTLIPHVHTLISGIPIISLIPFLVSPFQLLQVA